MTEIRIRAAHPHDARAVALVHVTSWRETYRGTLVSDDVLDSPELLSTREHFWIGALTDDQWAANRIAVAECDGAVIGMAMSGPIDSERWTRQLHVLYVLSEHHGSGAGAALLDAVIHPAEDAMLWVGDPVPRAQAFYRKSGFVPDGTAKIEDGIRQIRMLRAARP